MENFTIKNPNASYTTNLLKKLASPIKAKKSPTKSFLVLFVLLLTFFLGGSVSAQTTYSWRNDQGSAASGTWNNSNNWWNGAANLPVGGEILTLDGAVGTTMTNDLPSTNRHKITFGSTNTPAARTIGGTTTNNFFEFSTTWPRIQNDASNILHTINFPLAASTNSGFNLELVANAGALAFGGLMNNNGRTIQIYGNNLAVDATNRYIRLGGVLSGSGILNVSQFGVVKLSAAHTYTGQTQIDNGELWIETGGDISASSSIFVGNGGQLTNTTKLFISNSTGGQTFARNIAINAGNTGTRFLGGLNSSGTNTFSGTISGTTTDINLQQVTSGGTTNFSNVISHTGNLITLGAGTIKLSGTNTYTGTTTVSAGTLQLGSATVIPNASAVTVTGGLDLNNNSETVGSIAGAGTISTSVSGSPILTCGGNNTTTTFSGVFSNGSGTPGLTKSGTGTLTLTGNNTYTGATTVNGASGTLKLSATGNALDSGSAVTLTAGTLQISTNQTIGNLTMSGGTLLVDAGVTLTITGSYTGTSGTINNLGTIVLGGSAASQSFPGSSLTITTMTNLTVSNTAGITLNKAMTVLGTLTVKANSTFNLAAIALTAATVTMETGTSAGTTTISGSGILTLGAGGVNVNNTSGGNGAVISCPINLVAAATRTFTVADDSSATNDLSITAAITNTSGALTKAGAGTLILGAANLYTGLTTVNAGKLLYGITNALSSGSVTVNGGTLDMATFNDTVGTVTLTTGTIIGSTGVLTGTSYAVASGTVSAILAGAVAMTKTTGGTVVLSGTNTFSGGTSIAASGGTLTLNNTAALGAAGNAVTLSGGTLDLATDTSVNAYNVTVSGAATINSNKFTAASAGVTHTLGTLAISNTLSTTIGGNVTGGSPAITFGTTTLSSTPVFDVVASMSVTLGALTGNIAFTKQSTGQLNLNTASTRTLGVVTLTAGTMSLGSPSALGTTGVTVNLNGGILDLKTDTTVNAYPVTVGGAATINSNKATAASVGVTHTLGTLSIGNFQFNTGVGANVTSGTAGLTFGATTLSAATPVFDVASGANLTLGALTGNFAFTKQNAGQITLNTASARTTGTVTLAAGTMSLGNASALGTAAVPLFLNGGILDLANSTTVNAYPVTVGGNATINSNTATAVAGITHVLGTLSMGPYILSINKGAAATGSTAAVQFGNLTLTGNAIVSPGTANVLFSGSAGASGSYSLTKSGAGTMTKNTAGWSIPNAFTVSSGIYDSNGFTTTVAGLMTINGGTYTAGTAQQTFSAGLTVSGGTYTGLSGTAGLTTATAVTVSSGTLSAPGSTGTFNVSGDWSFSTGATFTNNSGTVTFTGGTQALGGTAATPFNNLSFTGAGTKTFGIATAIASNLSLSSSVILDLGTFTHSANTLLLNTLSQLAGSWGSTSSAATYKTNTYFSNTGLLNVATSSCSGKTWLGGVSTDWFTASNWCGNAIPLASDNVIIPAEAPNQPSITTSGAVCNNITINASATLAITGTNTLTVSGDWANSGTFTANNSTIDFNDASGTQIVNNGAQTFYNVTHSGAATLQQNTNAITATNLFTNAGPLDIKGLSFTVGGLTGAGAISSTVAGTLTITVNGALTPAAYSGVISNGTATSIALVKTSTGILTLSGANTYTGTTTITQGTISAASIVVSGSASNLGNNGTAVILGGAGTSGTLSYTGGVATFIRGLSVGAGGGSVINTTATVLTIATGGIATSGQLTFTNTSTGDTTVSSVITGAGSVYINNSGSGITNVTGTNTYSGLTTVNAGIMKIAGTFTGSNTPLGNTTNGTVVNDGGTIDLNGATLDSSPTEVLTINGTGVGGIGAIINSNISTTAAWNGSIVLASDASIGGAGNFGSNSGTFASNFAISGAKNLTKVGTGTMTMTQASTHTYGGATKSLTITQGTFVADGNTPSNSFGNSSTTIALNGGTLAITASSSATITNNITVSANGGTIDNPGTNHVSFNGTVALSGTLTAGNTTATKYIDFNGVISEASAGIGKLIVNNNAGTTTGVFGVRLSKVNTFTGGITVTKGILALNANSVVSSSCPITLNGGYLNTGSSSPLATSNSVGLLDVSTSATIQLSTVSSGNNITFADSHNETWSNGLIVITGWAGGYNGTAGANGTTQRIFVSGASGTGLSTSQLSQIRFLNASNYYTATILSSGEVVPTGTFTSGNAITTGTVSSTAICAGTSVTVPIVYTPAASFTAGQTFTAQLSNSSGSFASPVSVGTVVSDASGSQSITATIASGTIGGSGYLIRVISTTPAATGSNSAALTISAVATTATNTSTQSICSSATATLAGNVASVGAGAWSIVSGGTGTFSSTSSPTATFTPTSGAGTYVVRWTITNGSCSSSADATITVVGASTTATNTSTQTICASATATLAGNTASVGTGVWSVVSGPSTASGQFSDTALATAVFTPAGGAGAYLVRWTISATTPCSASSAEATITVTAAPTTATNGSTQTICPIGTATLSGNVPSVGTGAWSVQSGPSLVSTQFSNTALATAVFIPASSGTYVVRWTITNGSCSSYADATITANANYLDFVNLQYPGSGSTCVGSSFTVYGQVYEPGITTVGGVQGAGITAQFGYNTSNTNPNTWADVNWSDATFNAAGGGTPNDEYSYNFSTAVAGTYYYAYRYKITGCSAWQYGGYSATTGGTWDGSSYVSGVLTVNAAVGGTATATATSLCSGSSTSISVSGYTGTIQWQQSPDGSTSWSSVSGGSGATSATYTTPSLTSPTYYRALLTNSTCTANSTTASVTILPTASIASVTGTTPLCQSATTTYTANAVVLSGGTGSWSTDNSAVATVNATTGLVTAVGGGTCNIIYTITGGCGGTKTAQQSITVNATSVGGAVTTGKTQSICTGTSPSDIAITGYTGSVIRWEKATNSSFTSPTTISNTSATLTTATIGTLSATTYFRAVVQSGICSIAYTSDYATVTVSAASVGGTATATSPIRCSGTSTTLVLSGNTGSTIQWQQSSSADGSTGWSNVTGGSGATSSTYTTTNLTATTYYKAVVTSGTCTSSDSSTASVTMEVVAANTSSQTICSGVANLSASVPSSNTTGAWTIVSGPNTSTTQFSNTALPSASFTPTTAGSYVIRWTISGGFCGTSYADATIVVGSGSATTWNGTAWSNGAPTSTSTAYITGNYSSTTNGGSIIACTLTVSNNAVVNIASANDIILNGVLTVGTGSSVTIENNASLVQSANVTNVGKIIIKHNSSALFRLDYTLWSSPVASQNLVLFSPLTSVSPSRFYTYNTGTDLYDPITPPSASTFNTAQGYLIRMPNTWVAVGAGSAAAWTGTFTGVPNNGNISITMTNAGQGYNAVGNPYPSALNFANFIYANSANIEGTVYFWRKTNNSSNPVSYSTCTTIGCTVNNGHTYSHPELISAGQGFIVQAKAGRTTLNFTNGMRTSDNVNQFFRTSVVNRFWLELTNTANASFGKKLIAYVPEATLGYDSGLDGLFLNDTKTALLSVSDNHDLVIQARPEFTAADVVPLVLKADVADTYTINLQEVEGVFNGSQTVYLKDKLTNKSHDFSTGSYTFTTDAGRFDTRFEIVYQNPLAVNQLTFDTTSVVVYKQNNELIINSGNTTMTNVKVFDIRGRLLMEKNNINATQTKFYTGTTNEVLLVQITSDAMGTVTKKVIN